MIQARTLEKFKAQSPEIAQEIGMDPEDVKKVMEAVAKRINKYRRYPREPIPEGGISLRAAARKYNIPQATITYWYRKGYLRVLKVTSNWIYIDENSLIEYLKNKKGFSRSKGKICH